MFTLENKHAAVTGGGSGIGKAIAQVFAAQGAHVHILDLNEVNATLVQEEIKRQGGDASVYKVDVGNMEEVKQVFARLAGLDILVNSAGISHIGNAENTNEEDFDRLFTVNVKGVYHCLHVAIPIMKAAGKGIILNLASIASHVGLSDRFAYSMTKGAVFAMTLSVAKDYVKAGIRCNSISPARVHTPFVDGFLARHYPGKEKEMFDKLAATQPIGRMAKTTEIAHLALYLCSDESAFITGTDYPIDGGFLTLNS